MTGHQPPPAMPRRPTSDHPDPGLRPARERIREVSDAISRSRAGSQPQTPREAVQVFSGGNMPNQPLRVYWTHPLDIDAEDTEGATPTITPDTNQTIPVVVVRGTPSASQNLIASATAGRWVAEVGGTPPPQCHWLCGSAIGISGPTGCGGTGQPAVATMTIGAGGTITSVTLVNGGTCYTVAHPTVFIRGGGTGAAAVATVGEVTRITIANGGSAYNPAAPPTVTIAPPGGSGTTATATATVDPVTGAVTGITITSGGSLYQVANPTVTIAPPGAGGTQATATATAKPGVVTSLKLTAGGSGYISSSVPLVLHMTLSCPIWSITWPIFIQPIVTPPTNPPCHYFGTTTLNVPATAVTAAITNVTVTGSMSFGSVGGTQRWGVGATVGVQADTTAPHNCPGCITFGAHPVDGTIYGLKKSTAQHIENPDGSPTSPVGQCTSRPYSFTNTYSITPGGCFSTEVADWYVLVGGTCPTDGHTAQPPIVATLTVSEP